MTGDLWRPGEGDRMPATWWQLADRVPLQVRLRYNGGPGLAFAAEFTDRLSAAGPAYLDLSAHTAYDITGPDASPGRFGFDALTAAQPDTFTTVIGRPGRVWLALRLTRLTPATTAAIRSLLD